MPLKCFEEAAAKKFGGKKKKMLVLMSLSPVSTRKLIRGAVFQTQIRFFFSLGTTLNSVTIKKYKTEKLTS